MAREQLFEQSANAERPSASLSQRERSSGLFAELGWETLSTMEEIEI